MKDHQPHQSSLLPNFSLWKFFLLLISSKYLLSAEAADSHSGCHDVLVIGAGVSGLTAAKDLTEAHQEVLVLEANDVIGGRVRTAKVQGVDIDLGASWLHKMDSNPLKDLIKNHHLETQSTQYSLLSPLEKFQSMQRFDEHNQLNSPLKSRQI